MSLDEDIHILGRVRLFGSFSPEKLRLLAFGTERLKLRPGRKLFQEGQKADYAYIILSGNILLFRENDKARKFIYHVGPGTMLGEMALIIHTSRPTSAVVEGETEVLRISRSIFRRIIEEYPDLAARIHDCISCNMLNFIRDIEKMAPRFANPV
ncbi:cyclic nucleotide-binding domain-containing protein [Ochrobactrum sp. GPK 3]|uniref:cyclic nucleotide-binding domain-containing protein n=1 Tax=Brucella sp. 22210 TaxID=3453892 RepID=UPI0031384BC4